MDKCYKYLGKILENTELKSLVVFSERCELKKLILGDSIVIKRDELRNIILRDSGNIIYTDEQIDDFYNKLKKYSNKTNQEKQKILII